MHHIAIMNKKLGLISKILTGEKTIESRWYVAKRAPWNKVKPGDTVYFKDAGMPVTAKATVDKVLQFENFSEEKLREILSLYAESGKICFTSGSDMIFHLLKFKKYCILIFLSNPEGIEPFDIDKTGFGNACAWFCVEDISKIKIV